MIEPAIPGDERERLAELESYDILDTDPDSAFDDLTELAARICGTPIALVSLVDAQRQWFKSRHGLEATETPRVVSFCGHAITEPNDLLVIPDSHVDERFHDNPLVTGAPHVRSYAGAPLVSPNGHAVGTLCVIDSRPRRLSEDQLQTLTILGRQVVTQLELRRTCHQLNVRTTELQHTSDEVFRRNQEIKTFYHTLAHELKTPLTAAREFVSILLDRVAGPINPDQQDYLEIAQSCCDQITVHVNDLLDMTRLDTGKLALQVAPGDIREIAEDAVASLRRHATDKDIVLELDAATDLPVATIDGTRMTQVFSNLINNAIKFTEPGGRVTVRLWEPREAPGMISVEVSDTGIGMAKEHLERVFDRLYQINRTDSEGKGGLGIGLSLCREIVSRHGGTIGVTSERGNGSTFSFTIPAAAPAAEAA